MPRDLFSKVYPDEKRSAVARKAAVSRADKAAARRALIARVKAEHNRYPSAEEFASL